MPERRPDVVEVVVLAADAHALLRRRGARVRALLLAEEHVLELVHPGVGEEQRRVVVRHERRARHERVAVLFEVLEETAANFARTHLVYCSPSDQFVITALTTSASAVRAIVSRPARPRRSPPGMNPWRIRYWIQPRVLRRRRRCCGRPRSFFCSAPAMQRVARRHRRTTSASASLAMSVRDAPSRAARACTRSRPRPLHLGRGARDTRRATRASSSVRSCLEAGVDGAVDRRRR